MAEQGQEKTEQPTQKRLDDSRQEGQVPKSIEIISFAVFTTGLLSIIVFKNYIGSNIAELTSNIFKSLDTLQLNVNVVQMYFIKSGIFLLATIMPVTLTIMVGSIAANVGQFGFRVSMKALAPKMSKFNPIAGIKRLFFSTHSLVELLKSLMKLIIVGGFTYYILDDLITQAMTLPEFTIDEITSKMIDYTLRLVIKVALIYAVLAAVDFIFQKKKFMKEMMMTKQEVKEEMRQTEGDPMVKSKIRSVQYEMARRRMMQDVPKADVVITNPTHFAIAIKYEAGKDSAPKVLAKGVDEVAQRIKKIAVEHNVPLYEDKQLARALYKFCEVGEFIPEKLFHAVAKVLAYIYNLKRSKKKKSIV
ncbi:MAG: flagellar biosynthesis protein FlhB [Ignavibacteriales bacterium]